MTWRAARIALQNGAYCRSGDTGRGQVWQGGVLVGVCGPLALEFMRRNPCIQTGMLTVYGIPRRVYRWESGELFGAEGNFASDR